LSSAAAQHVTAFNDVQVAMALCAAGDDASLTLHLDSMAAYAGVAAVAARPAAAPPAALPALWASAARVPAAAAVAARAAAAATDDADFLADALGSAAADAPDGGLADNVVVTAAVGLDLAHGLTHFWRAMRRGAASSRPPPPPAPPPPPPAAASVSWGDAFSAVFGGAGGAGAGASATPPSAGVLTAGPLSGAAAADARTALALLVRSRA
jgi:hypothetical protein